MSGTYSALRTAAPGLLGSHAYRRPHRAEMVETRAPAPTDRAPRVHVAGSTSWTDPATVRVALTRAWRDLGRPIVVVTGGGLTGVDAAACAWVLEHAFAGIRLATGPPDHPDLTLAFPAPHPRPTPGDQT